MCCTGVKKNKQHATWQSVSVSLRFTWPSFFFSFSFCILSRSFLLIFPWLQIFPLCCFPSNSDDNLLKNIELFDKLVLRFNGRVLFVKDVLGDEICCWSFYGEGRKIAEVCCTSIVYATEKKQTKVRMTRCVHWVLKYWFDKLAGNVIHCLDSSLTA